MTKERDETHLFKKVPNNNNSCKQELLTSNNIKSRNNIRLPHTSNLKETSQILNSNPNIKNIKHSKYDSGINY